MHIYGFTHIDEALMDRDRIPTRIPRNPETHKNGIYMKIKGYRNGARGFLSSIFGNPGKKIRLNYGGHG